jgi:hypothetical protein
MELTALLRNIDEEIARLQQARALLVGTNSPRRRGRPPGSSNKPKPTLVKKKRTMSAAGRKRIAEAQKARWAKQKKAAAKAA